MAPGPLRIVQAKHRSARDATACRPRVRRAPWSDPDVATKPGFYFPVTAPIVNENNSH